MSTLEEWLKYLETLDPHKIRLGLDRINKVAGFLQLDSFQHPVITVTGTNGKGSCVAFLEAIYLAASYRVGAYTSPHLFRFNERIRINGKDITDDILVAAFATIENARQEIPLTYFEFTTLAALQIFQRAKLDVLILEVGLGGRLDAVNIIDADVAVISTIGIDHTDWLGKDRDSIGREKAGIFRAKKIAVCGDPQPPESIYQVATRLSTKLFVAGQDFSWQKSLEGWHWQATEIELRDLPNPTLECQNAATSLMALQLLQARLPVSIEAIVTGSRQASLPGRFQRLEQCIFDVAHNPHAAHWLAKKLRQEPCKGRTLAVVGMLADKDIFNTLAALREEVDVWYAGTLTNFRGASGQLLTENLTEIGVKKCYNNASVEEAFTAAQADCEMDDRVLIFGSFYTVSACLSLYSYGKGEI